MPSFAALADIHVEADTGWDTLADGAEGQTNVVDNTSLAYMTVICFIFLKMNQSGAAVANAAINVYLFRHDQTSLTISDDHTVDTDGSITVKNSPPIVVLSTGSSPGISNDTRANEVERSFIINDPGPWWGLSIENLSGQSLHSANHLAKYIGITY